MVPGNDYVAEDNRTMRARGSHDHWTDIVAAEAPWLTSILADFDLLELDDAECDAADGDNLVVLRQ